MRRGFLLFALLSLALSALAASPGREAVHERAHSPDVPAGEVLRIEHLAGPIRVIGGADRIELRLRGIARADSEAKALEIAEGAHIALEDDGVYRTRFPLDGLSSIYYQPRGREDGGFQRQIRHGGDRLTVQSPTRWGRGLHLHAELDIHLPDAQAIDLIQPAGPVSIEAFGGPLRLRGNGDPVSLADTGGDLDIDTGGGSLVLDRHRGELLRLRSGSGRMALSAVSAGRLSLETGSGAIRLRAVSGNMELKTGSGGVEATEFLAGEHLHIESGSGRVLIEGELAAVRSLDARSTGGAILLLTASPPDLRLDIVNVRGGIEVDLPGLSEVREGRNRYRATLGEGRGEGRIESRMGQIRFVTAPAGAVRSGMFDD
jgi:hypothetical protein